MSKLKKRVERLEKLHPEPLPRERESIEDTCRWVQSVLADSEHPIAKPMSDDEISTLLDEISSSARECRRR